MEDKEEIDALYKLIYEQIKKPSFYIPNLDPERPNPAERDDRFRIFEKMLWVLGVENVDKDFSKKYKFVNFGFENVSFKKEIIKCILLLIIGIPVLIYFYWIYFIR